MKPGRDQYTQIYKEQSSYGAILKSQEREVHKKKRKLKEDEDYGQLLDSLQTNLDDSIAPRQKVFIAGLFPRGSVSAVTDKSKATEHAINSTVENSSIFSTL